MLNRIYVLVLAMLLSSFALADPSEVLKQKGITLPKVDAPLANYVKTVRAGKLVFTSGHVSVDVDGKAIKGKLGGAMTIEQGQHAAKATAIQILASLQHELGDLNKIKRIVKVLGMVNASPDFTEHSQVMNGFSDFMVDVFGDKGRHARSAVGMSSLPGNYALEIEVIVEIE
ncbi:RidA family protein [Agaribacter marinus]|uniref:Endoribonuclease L-PSP/chorismate mutase-like domain-containing protein n=1 Tax=Agaribacter marinus TaxID=1431249 RepID=A0AA37SYR5_9ALTE|nr:RidA family protein [Agaribacter marinus]GLR72657.1 hypothetical protein GCM10007852_35650 [Agaribacter marinus]